MKRALLWLFLPLLLLGGALAQEGETVYALVDGNGELLTHIAADVEAGDEYIDQGNRLFKVVSVDEASLTATVELAGEEPMLSLTALEIGRTAQTKSVGIYVTHSDEAYEDGDGASSIDSGWTGIHDVAWALGESLEEMGVEVLFDPSVHLPHDAGAYRRSRATAVELLKQGPSALIDVHRDGIPDASEYTTEVDGEEMTQVRLLVGRSNPNSAANREFAKKLKAAADSEYPGLIKDIFIGKGNYNQELMPQSILLEFGTHTSNKEEVLRSTELMADVLHTVLFGTGGSGAATQNPSQSGQGDEAQGENVTGTPQGAQQEDGGSGVATGIAWIVGIAVLGAIAFAVISSGSLKAVPERLKRFSSELTGGVVGNKPEEGEDKDDLP